MIFEKNIPLHDKNWFGTGGQARLFAQPQTAADFAACMQHAIDQECDVFVLGQGANILINDDGFDGLVIRPALNQIKFDSATARVTAGAGVCMQELIKVCLEQRMLGLEEFAAIPGTVGGAVYINIHYFQFLLSSFLVNATVVNREGVCQQVDASWFDFGYNQSRLLEKQDFLVDATFQLRMGSDLDAAYARGRRDEIERHRRARYPYARTCGSFFRNFLADEVTFLINDKQILFVAYYLDKLGVKGALSNGLANVSHQHANMIVTQQGASSQDVINLARDMQQRVFDEFGIVPQAECQFIGFAEHPLYTYDQLAAAQQQPVDMLEQPV